MANLAVLAVAAGLAVLTGAVLYAVAVRRARAIEAGPEEQRAHELRVLLKRLSSISAGCGAGAAGLAIVWTIEQLAGSVPDGFLAGAVAACCAAVPVLAARRPVIEAYARVRGVPASAFRSYRSRAVLAIRLALLLWPVLAALAITGPPAWAATRPAPTRPACSRCSPSWCWVSGGCSARWPSGRNWPPTTWPRASSGRPR